MDTEITTKLPQALLPWFDINKRDLPWRQDKEPYHVWLSEIMLQQTRVEAARGYYSRFLAALPTVSRLAEADDDLLRKLWEGLGYYSRVRNLKKAAQIIMERHGGTFPRSYEEILALPGIGPYTAGAISSICFDLPTPAVDGNVLRVVSRLTSDFTPINSPAYKKAVETGLRTIYPSRAGDFTQALMELGATLCGPNRAPRCEECPCAAFCQAKAAGTAEQLPVRSPKKGKRLEEKTVFILSCDGRYALRRRPDTGLLAGMWEFPNVPGKLSLPESEALLRQWGLHPKHPLRQTQRQHIFTHIRWDMAGIYWEVTQPEGEFLWLTDEEIRREAALPSAFRQFWKELNHV